MARVGHPGKYTLRGETTVTFKEGLALAGGLTEKSKHSQVVLFRRVSSQWTEAKVMNVKRDAEREKSKRGLRASSGRYDLCPAKHDIENPAIYPTANMAAYVTRNFLTSSQ